MAGKERSRSREADTDEIDEEETVKEVRGSPYRARDDFLIQRRSGLRGKRKSFCVGLPSRRRATNRANRSLLTMRAQRERRVPQSPAFLFLFLFFCFL